jgi:large conductance mechanosensitive channel
MPDKQECQSHYQEEPEMLDEFKAFINRGSVLDLAVAVILGVAFGAIVTSFVNDILMQIIAAIFGQPDFGSLTFNLGSGVIKYGSFLNAVINFLIVAFAIFLVIKAYNQMRKPTPAVINTKECPYCLSTIPLGATRCPNCTSELTKAQN